MHSDVQDASDLLRQLLVGTGFAGFAYGTSFSLRFERNSAAPGLPWALELRLDATWWFGAFEVWERDVADISAPNVPDPEEALQAARLVGFRWASGSEVAGADFDGQILEVAFTSGETLFVTAEESDESWALAEPGHSPHLSGWAVWFEHGELCSRSGS